MTVYEAAGGEEPFFALVHAFYEGVAEDPMLRALYPPDLEPAEHRLALFLIQYFGGPTTYNQERGHPRLRLRHMPFPINTDARERWLRHMRAALAASHLTPDVQRQMLDYFESTATFLINRVDP